MIFNIPILVFGTLCALASLCYADEYSFDIESGIAQEELSRKVSGSETFSILASPSYSAQISLSWYPWDSWKYYANVHFRNHFYQAPAAKTFDETNIPRTDIALGLQYEGKAYAPFIQVVQKPTVLIRDIATDQHEIKTVSSTHAALGLKLFAASRASFILEVSGATSLPVQAAEFENEEIEFSPNFLVEAAIRYGKKGISGGLKVGLMAEEYILDQEQYAATNIWAQTFLSFPF